jgi:hypothetical protein
MRLIMTRLKVFLAGLLVAVPALAQQQIDPSWQITGVSGTPSGTANSALALTASPTFTGTVALPIVNASGRATFNAGISIPTGQSITGAGTAAITGFAGITATNLTGTLQTAAQPAITSVGTLTGLTLSGNVDLGANHISNDGTAAGLSFDSSNNATFSANLTIKKLLVTSSANSAQVYNASVATGDVSFYGGNAVDNGGAIRLFGGSHGAVPNHVWITEAGTTIGDFSSTGLAVTGTLSATGLLTVGGSSPASGAACTAGTITWDASYLYACTASGAWKRAALTGGY